MSYRLLEAWPLVWAVVRAARDEESVAVSQRIQSGSMEFRPARACSRAAAVFSAAIGPEECSRLSPAMQPD
jgi:hypothetical protein